jgi:hypothetical protein
MATIEQLAQALVNADKAGDTDAARALAAEITRLRSEPREHSDMEKLITGERIDQRDNFAGKIDTFMRGAADTLSFGLADEIAAGGDALFNPIFGTGQDGGSLSERYASNLDAQRGIDAADAENRGGYRLGGQLAGGVTGGVGLARNGLSFATNAAGRGASLARLSGASGVDGLLMGGAQGFGSGEGVEGRLYNAGLGAVTGAALGSVTPAAVAGGSKVVKSAVAPFVAPFMPDTYAQDAVALALRRSGRTPEQIRDVMTAAVDDGQGVYNLADAMGHTGQRLMSTVARNPHDARQQVAEALLRRQAGQADRLSNALAEGFDATDTAAQRAARLTDARGAEANRLYGAARRDAGAVNVTPVIEAIDETLSPGVNSIVNPRDRIANDSIEGALSRVRSMITDGRSNVTDFNTLFRTKLDLDDMIQRAEGQGAGNRAHYLSDIQRRIDQALAEASPSYAQARDAFSTASRQIDAVGSGTAAASGRRRAEDTIGDFATMSPEEQAAFRAGYVDPLIARVEGGATGPMTNKARVLTTPKFEQEFQQFAAPGRAEQLGHRIGREQRMFETNQAALGGSKTADNLADASDLKKFDPGIMSSLMRGDYLGALINGTSKALSTAQGTPPSVLERVAKAMIETNPEAAFGLLNSGTRKLTKSDQLRARIAAALLNSGAAGVGRGSGNNQRRVPLEITVPVPIR